MFATKEGAGQKNQKKPHIFQNFAQKTKGQQKYQPKRYYVLKVKKHLKKKKKLETSENKETFKRP